MYNKMYLISDNIDTLTGLRLVGIQGALVHTREELLETLTRVSLNTDYGIVLIVERLAREFPELIKDIRLNRRHPLVAEIPDRHGMGREKDFISAYVMEAIGVRL